MKILLRSIAFIISLAPSMLSTMESPDIMTDAQAIKNAKALIRQSHFQADPSKKEALLEQAAHLFEPIYKNKAADQQLRFDARTHLEGIYARCPRLKLPRVLKIMAQEDKKIQISPEARACEVAEINNVETDEGTAFSSAKKRKQFSRKMFGSELAEYQIIKKAETQKKISEAQKKKLEKEKSAEQKKQMDDNDPDKIILETCDKLFQKKQFRECAQNCWLLVKSPQKNIQKKAKNLLSILHEQKKDRDAAYYLAALEKDNPKRMVDLFLEAEARRDISAEQKEFASLAREANQINSLNQQPDAAEVVTATSDAMACAAYELIHVNKEKHPRAYHALSVYYSNQATVFPAMQETLLKKALEYAEKAGAEPQPKICMQYPQLLNNLGMALCQNATNLFNNKKIQRDELNERFDSALEYFKKASAQGCSFGTFNTAQIQMQQFRDSQLKHKLPQALASFAQALAEGAPEAQKQIEALLLEGIEDIPLNPSQRVSLLNALKKNAKDSRLLIRENFKNSAYYAASLIKNKPGNEQFYEGLYWFDQGNIQKAREVITPLRGKHAAASCFLMSMAMNDPNPSTALEVIKNSLPLYKNLEFHERIILNESAKASLATLVTQNNIHAVYMFMSALLHGVFEICESPTQEIIKLLDKGEEILKNGQNPQMRSKFYEKSFLDSLVNFAKQNQNPVVLYKAIEIGLKRLETPLAAAESYELKNRIATISMLLNHELGLSKKNYVPCVESATTLSEQIRKHLESKHEQPYFQTLRSLIQVLQGKQQPMAAIDPVQSSDDALVYYLKREAARNALFARVALKSGQNTQANNSLRDLIRLFRDKDTCNLYASLECKKTLFNELAAQLSKKKFVTPEEIFYEMSYKMILIADQALTNTDCPVENNFDSLCVEYPILGATMVAQELAANVLFPRNLDKATLYLERAKLQALSKGESPQNISYIQEVEKTIKDARNAQAEAKAS